MAIGCSSSGQVQIVTNHSGLVEPSFNISSIPGRVVRGASASALTGAAAELRPGLDCRSAKLSLESRPTSEQALTEVA